MSYSKYHAKRTTVDGIAFASKAEASFYSTLQLLKAGGKIESFQCQVPFTLYADIVYICDFLVKFPGGFERVVDVKGVMTPEFRIKRKLWVKDYGFLYGGDIVIVRNGLWPALFPSMKA